MSIFCSVNVRNTFKLNKKTKFQNIKSLLQLFYRGKENEAHESKGYVKKIRFVTPMILQGSHGRAIYQLAKHFI